MKKETPTQVLPMNIAKFLRAAFLKNTSDCLLLTVLPQSVVWFCASTCFRFWSKTCTKRCTNNSLLSRDKTISCLSWLITCFRFQNIFWNYICCFRFWWINFWCTNNYVISLVKPKVSSPALYNFQDMIWKMEECPVSNNIELKIPILN